MGWTSRKPGWGIFKWCCAGATALALACDGSKGAGVTSETSAALEQPAHAWKQTAELLASDGYQTAALGAAVSLSKNSIIVGDPDKNVGSSFDQGAAYVFTADAGVWTQQQELSSADGVSGDAFGEAVVIDGDVAVAGAPFKTLNGEQVRGAAYVFTRTNGVWSLAQELTAPNGAFGDAFGGSLALAGNTLAIGAPGRSSDKGAVYVFSNSGGRWSVAQELTALESDLESFGNSLALSGQTLVVGAPLRDDMGAVYVYGYSDSTWTLQGELQPTDGVAGDWFGGAVAISGDTLVIGDDQKTVGNNQDQGVAYVFKKEGAQWAQIVELQAFLGGAYDHFGHSLSLSGDTALVGAAGHGSGAAYSWEANDAGVWVQTQQLGLAGDGGVPAQFGASVSLSGDRAVIGAPGLTVGNNQAQGAAFVEQL
jgi:hypothetical protein